MTSPFLSPPSSAQPSAVAQSTHLRPGEHSILSAIRIALRHPKALLLSPIVFVLAVGGYSLNTALSYQSKASFLPQSSGGGQLKGLAAQLGLDAGGGSPAESPYYYVDLIKLDAVLGRVATDTFQDPQSGRTTPLMNIYGAGSDTAELRERAVGKLRRRITADADRRTGIVTISATDRSPRLAREIVQSVLDELNRFNQQNRQSRATSERRFAEARLTAARADLQSAEERLESFLVQNRTYVGSPSLQVQAERLNRTVSFRSALVTTLTQNYEQARMDEVRDTPVISIVQPPTLPRHRNTQGLLGRLVFATVIGIFLGVVIAALSEWFRTMRNESPNWWSTVRLAAKSEGVE
jgi:uncharacterized protein involved in exopolysaccharide biosynthesis